MFDNMKNRKLKFALMMWAVGTISWFFGLMEASEWTQFSYVILGVFGVTNVGEHAASAYKAKSAG